MDIVKIMMALLIKFIFSVLITLPEILTSNQFTLQEKKGQLVVLVVVKVQIIFIFFINNTIKKLQEITLNYAKIVELAILEIKQIQIAITHGNNSIIIIIKVQLGSVMELQLRILIVLHVMLKNLGNMMKQVVNVFVRLDTLMIKTTMNYANHAIILGILIVFVIICILVKLEHVTGRLILTVQLAMQRKRESFDYIIFFFIIIKEYLEGNVHVCQVLQMMEPMNYAWKNKQLL